MKELRGAGGTEGGFGSFVIGALMAVAGVWLLTNQVTVTTGYWRLWGYNAFGLSLLPFIIGIAFLFFDGKSIAGWVLTLAGAVIVFIGILSNLDVYFRPTSLFNTLLMLVLLFGGIGLVARALRPHRTS
jgi:predicted membrane channel-forming protein YqfA (hemolysin III family)